MNKIIIKSFLFFIIYISWSYAETVKKIEIIGNKRIAKETILEYGEIKKNINYSTEILNEIQKKIYNTGFFQDVITSIKNETFTIKVVENPMIDFFNIQGDPSSETTNKLYDLVKLQTNKIFSDYLFKKDLETIKDYYIQLGFLEVEITPRISKLDQNRVNILITVNKNDESKINRIYFIGNKVFKNSDLLNEILSSETGWWKFLSSNILFNQKRIEVDQTLLKRFYLNNGYYDMQINSTEIKKISKNRVNIIFSINAGERYNFGNLNVINDENLISDEILKFIESSKKKYFEKEYSFKKLRVFLDDLNNYTGKNKLEFIDYNLEQMKNNKNIDLVLRISSGKKQYVKNIKVLGNSITEEEVIRRNILFSEGDGYSEYKINKSIDNIKSLNIFKKTVFNKNDINSNEVDIEIKVEEQPTGSISAGAGYGGNGAIISFALNEANFLGKGINLGTDLQIGSQQILGKIFSNIPDFYDSGKSLYSSIYSSKYSLANTLFESKKIGTEISTGYELYENIFFKPGLGVEFEDVSVDNNAGSYLRNQNGSYINNKIFYNLENDLRDSKVNTRKGSIYGITQTISSFGSDLPYFKNTLYGSNYFPITEKQTLNIKYGYSNISSLDNQDIKLSDRLFIPYQYTKGFAPRGFGPRDSTSKEYVGGTNSLYATASASFPNPVQESWGINSIAFINAANIWGADNSNISESNLIRSAIGLGFDWRSPLGPLNVSLAKPISKADTDQTKFFTFEIGTIF